MNKIGIFYVGMIALLQCANPIACHGGINNDGSESEMAFGPEEVFAHVDNALVNINEELTLAFAQLEALDKPYPSVFKSAGSVCGKAIAAVQQARVLVADMTPSHEKIVLQSQILCVNQLIKKQFNQKRNFPAFKTDVIRALRQPGISFIVIDAEVNSLSN